MLVYSHDFMSMHMHGCIRSDMKTNKSADEDCNYTVANAFMHKRP